MVQKSLRKLRYWILGIAGFLLLINMLGIFPYYQWQAFHHADERLGQDHILLANMLEAASLLTHMETGQRGYLITGDPRFLKSYLAVYGVDMDEAGRLPPMQDWPSLMPAGQMPVALHNIFQEMRAQLSGDRVSLDRLSQIEQLFIQKSDHTRQELMPALSGDFERSHKMVRIGGGQVLMDRVKEQLGNFIEDLRERQHDMVLEAGRTATLYGRIAAIGNLGGGLLLLAAFISLLRSHMRERHMRTQLKRNEEQLRLFIRNMPSAVGAMDRNLRFFLASDRWAQEFDTVWYSSPIGLTLPEIFPHFKERTDWQEAVKRCFTGEVVMCAEDRIKIGENPDIWAQWELHPWYDESGHVGSVIISVENITKRKDMERMKSEFISTVSHELRTPLTSIRGSLGLLEGGVAGELSEKAQELVQIAHKNSDRLILLINDILDMDKINAERIEFSMQSAHVETLMHDVLESNGGYASEFGVELLLTKTDGRSHIFIDPDRFQQVMSNLISNAIKFSPKNGRVEIGFFVEQSQVRIFVRDHGAGIPYKFQTNIFQRFSQADSSDTRARGGTGLGLSIAKALTEKMGGWISFESREGRGTTFWVEFPLYDTSTSMPELSSAPQDCPEGKVRVLHVEDDPDFFRMMRNCLDKEAYIVNARNIKDALRMLDHCEFDLILLDMVLPDGSGFAILERIRDKKSCEVIVISAFDIPDQARTRALACMVKTRTPEKQITAIVLSAICKIKKDKQDASA